MDGLTFLPGLLGHLVGVCYRRGQRGSELHTCIHAQTWDMHTTNEKFLGNPPIHSVIS